MWTSHTSRPSFHTRFGSMFTTMHWLPNRRAAWRTNSGSRQAAELIDTLSQPAFSNGADVLDRADAAADGQGHENHLGRPPHDLDQRAAALVAGGDVEEHQFVGPFLLIARSDLDGIAGVPEVEEVRSFDDPAPIDIEARNHPFGQHRHNLEVFALVAVPKLGKETRPCKQPNPYSNLPGLRRSTPRKDEAEGRRMKNEGRLPLLIHPSSFLFQPSFTPPAGSPGRICRETPQPGT